MQLKTQKISKLTSLHKLPAIVLCKDSWQRRPTWSAISKHSSRSLAAGVLRLPMAYWVRTQTRCCHIARSHLHPVYRPAKRLRRRRSQRDIRQTRSVVE